MLLLKRVDDGLVDLRELLLCFGHYHDVMRFR
jgi:hypothetical protein